MKRKSTLAISAAIAGAMLLAACTPTDTAQAEEYVPAVLAETGAEQPAVPVVEEEPEIEEVEEVEDEGSWEFNPTVVVATPGTVYQLDPDQYVLVGDYLVNVGRSSAEWHGRNSRLSLRTVAWIYDHAEFEKMLEGEIDGALAINDSIDYLVEVFLADGRSFNPMQFELDGEPRVSFQHFNLIGMRPAPEDIRGGIIRVSIGNDAVEFSLDTIDLDEILQTTPSIAEPVGPGSLSNPYAIGTPLTVGEWELVVTSVETVSEFDLDTWPYRGNRGRSGRFTGSDGWLFDADYGTVLLIVQGDVSGPSGMNPFFENDLRLVNTRDGAITSSVGNASGEGHFIFIFMEQWQEGEFVISVSPERQAGGLPEDFSSWSFVVTQ